MASAKKYPYVILNSKGLFLNIVVQPRASRNEVIGIYDGNLKIALTASPVGGETNRACIKFLSDILGVSPSKVRIVSGHRSRKKRIFVESQNPDLLLSLLPL
ncbi:MAG: DUF167 domain-containing protein [Syntrophobacterales bacterium]|nr:DUF167 domain-containing protein [Syntrophobacterales bacterium]